MARFSLIECQRFPSGAPKEQVAVNPRSLGRRFRRSLRHFRNCQDGIYLWSSGNAVEQKIARMSIFERLPRRGPARPLALTRTPHSCRIHGWCRILSRRLAWLCPSMGAEPCSRHGVGLAGRSLTKIGCSLRARAGRGDDSFGRRPTHRINTSEFYFGC